MVDLKEKGAALIVWDLERKGHRAYFCGGVTRDMVMGRQYSDIDICTTAWPEQVQRFFPRTAPAGERHGVVKVTIQPIPDVEIMEGYTSLFDYWETYDVATFRTDGNYSDGRRPDQVIFTQSLFADSKRRDFTINAMYWNPFWHKDDIIDFHGGIKDIKDKIIRCVGEPNDRIAEDKLRMLRAVRFACQLGFTISSDLELAIWRFSSGIQDISWERIRDELLKILGSSRASWGIQKLHDLDLLPHILPEVERLKRFSHDQIHHPGTDENVFNHSLGVLEKLTAQAATPELCLAGLIHDIGKPDTQKIYTDDQQRIRIRNLGHAEVGAKQAIKLCERLKLSNDQTDRVVSLVGNHMKAHLGKEFRRKTLIEFLRSPYIQDQIKLQRADSLNSAHPDRDLSEFYLEKLDTLDLAIHATPLVKGKDLIEWGYSPGRHFTEKIKYIRDLQDQGIVRTKEEARNELSLLESMRVLDEIHDTPLRVWDQIIDQPLTALELPATIEVES